MKKLSLILVYIMLFLCIPNTTLAQDIVVISTAEQFISFADELRSGSQADAVLINDIDLGCTAEHTFLPIPNLNSTLDGRGHTISGLYIKSDDNRSALFQYIGSHAVIKNITFKGNVYGARAASVVDTNNGLIKNVISQMNVFGQTSASGIVYKNENTITNCENQGDIYISSNGRVAGIAAVNSEYGTINNCTNYGTINGTFSDGAAEYTAGICCIIRGGEFRDNINVGSVIGKATTAGIACELYGISEISDCINIGEVTGNGEGVAGIACFPDNVDIIHCTNYGAVKSTNNNVAGIAVTSNARLENCSNYADISGETYVAGIISNGGSNMWCEDLSHVDIIGCTNSGSISGSSYTSGITSFLNGNIANCANYGTISGARNRTAGVVSHFQNGNMERCANIADVFGTTDTTVSSNFTGGVIAYMNDSANATFNVKNIFSAGMVSGKKVCGGAIGYASGNIDNVFSFGESNSVIHEQNSASVSNAYNSYYWGYKVDYFDKFASGELAYMLNQSTSSSGEVWSQGISYPIFANEHSMPVQRITLSSDLGAEFIVYTGSNGKADAPQGVNIISCYNDQGILLDKNEVLHTGTDLYTTAYASTPAELIDALTNSYTQTVYLDNSITLAGSVTTVGNKEIIANGNRITFSSGGFIVPGTLTTNNLSVVSNSPFIVEPTGVLIINGYLETTQTLDIGYGMINLSNGRIYNKLESNSLPQFTISDAHGVIGASELKSIGNAFYHIPPVLDTEPWNIVALEQYNDSLYMDIHPTYKGNTAYFFLPCTADIHNITYSIIGKDGAVLDTIPKVDFTSTSPTVTLKGTTYSITAMQSALPTLSFNINEDFGTIEAMNTSPDHSIKCFGDVRLDITDEVASAKGWSGFISKEKDETKNGTMEIKGRGNSTWNTDPYAKKPYQFKLENKENILNMGAHKTWVIIKNDKDIIKNKLGLDLGLDMGLSCTSSSEFVDVFMNGNYLGNYLLCEKVQIDKNRVNISSLDDEYEDNGNSIDGLDMTGGYLMEIDNWGGDDLQVYHEPSTTTISIKEPEGLASKVRADNEYSYIYNYLNDFFNAIYLNNGIMPDGRSYLSYIDTTSFVRYFFHQEFLRNGDCGRGSTYLYKDKDSIDPLLYAGPIWDNDRIFEDNTYTGWFLQTINYAENSKPTFYNILSKRTDFSKLLVSGYENDPVIRQSLEKAYEYVDAYVNDLGNSPEMNSIRWNLPEFDVAWLKNILKNRFEWVDANYKTLFNPDSLEFLNVISTSDSISASIFNNKGFRLSCELLLVQYDDSNMVGLDMFNISNLGINKQTPWYDIKLNENTNNSKIFLWDSIESMIPVNTSVTFKNK